MGGTGQYQGPRAQHKAIPQTAPSVLQRWCRESPVRCRGPNPLPCFSCCRTDHIWRETQLLSCNFRQCFAHCGVTQSVRTAHSSLLSPLPAVTGNLLKSFVSVFTSKRTKLLPRHYFYFFYCLNYFNCYKIKKFLCSFPGFRSLLLKEVFFLSFKVDNNSIYAYFLFQICSQWIYNYGHTDLTSSIIRLSKCHFCSSWAFAMFYQSKKLHLIFIFHVPQKRATEQYNLLRLLYILFALYHFVIKHAFPLQVWLRVAQLLVVSGHLNIVREERTGIISKICMFFRQSKVKLEINNLHVSESRQKYSEPAWSFWAE